MATRSSFPLWCWQMSTKLGFRSSSWLVSGWHSPSFCWWWCRGGGWRSARWRHLESRRLRVNPSRHQIWFCVSLCWVVNSCFWVPIGQPIDISNQLAVCQIQEWCFWGWCWLSWPYHHLIWAFWRGIPHTTRIFSVDYPTSHTPIRSAWWDSSDLLRKWVIDWLTILLSLSAFRKCSYSDHQVSLKSLVWWCWYSIVRSISWVTGWSGEDIEMEDTRAVSTKSCCVSQFAT